MRAATPITLLLLVLIAPIARGGSDWTPYPPRVRKEPVPPSPAVARINVRATGGYRFEHVDGVDTTFFGAVTSGTLRTDDVDAHAAWGELVATVPITRSTGARGRVRGGFAETRRSLDAADPDASELDAIGGELELFWRDPSRGAFAAGGHYDRLMADGGLDADAYGGSAEAIVFVPDLGSGPVDWGVRFDFTRRQVSGSALPFDVDAVVYRVEGTAGWYATPNVQVLFGGRWSRVEEELVNEDDRVGFLGLRWRLPLPGPVGVELSARGTAGLSEYKEAPFRGDQRLLYGGEAAITLRFNSGATLLDSIRAHD